MVKTSALQSMTVASILLSSRTGKFLKMILKLSQALRTKSAIVEKKPVTSVVVYRENPRNRIPPSLSKRQGLEHGSLLTVVALSD